ncbi:MAG: MBL fold metallo-hydrolase, partial [Acetobacteraceae bacterium]|nr:MBL fold metallo-hydrolase [Acetobacteraceae bacterium]
MFLTEPEPARGAALPVIAGVRRVVARNPGRMTYHGTNTYLVDLENGVAVVDPGPNDDMHVRELLAAALGEIRLILLTHSHIDHAGAVDALSRQTGAAVAAWHQPSNPQVKPDILLQQAAVLDVFTALHTPGHAADHVCFAYSSNGKRVLFSADHVMSWSTSIVSPPDGNMADYFRSLALLLEREDDVLLPGHGPQIFGPRPFVEALLQHRIDRETAVLRAIEHCKQSTPASVLDEVYGNLEPGLRPMAVRTSTAHLLKLEAEG